MSAEEQHEAWKILLVQAYERFHVELRKNFDCRWSLFPYDFSNSVGGGKWRYPANGMVAGDLNEAINIQNSWCTRLQNWSSWIRVLQGYKDGEEWDIRSHFVEPLAESCMLQPSSTRDRLGSLATTAIHQANLVVVSGYVDRLDQDWKGKIANRYLTRKETEAQLSPDDLFHPVEHAADKVVQYAMGGIAALSMEEMVEVNGNQFMIAVATLKAYEELLKELMSALEGQGARSP